ncbi:phosphate acetyltransferase [Rhizohabitans arisaemae]|uniref:phosphate acetyltransferase n=1 Tax=Rhizohabitans arisaemae TaxID=2720610 RepID=UPI0024B13870|nr:phosphate acetyltransferase [Rhizohabitans arisaemae]
MTKSIYVAGIGRRDGRQIVELGLAELLSTRVDRVGVFRPITHDGEDVPWGDRTLELLHERYRLVTPAPDARGISSAEAAELYTAQGTEALISRIVTRFHTLEQECDGVLILGSHFESDDLPRELGFNARLAAECGAPVIAVVGGLNRDADEINMQLRSAYQTFTDLRCEVLAVIANRIGDGLDIDPGLPVPCYVIPENPVLSAPTIAQVVAAVRGTLLLGDDESLLRDVRGYVFGGATIPVFLDHLTEGSLVIAPGDRSDILIAAMSAHAASSPPLAGVVLTLGEKPNALVTKLAKRLAPGVPVLSSAKNSFTVANTLGGLEGRLDPENPRKVEIALGHFDRHVDTADLSGRIELATSDHVTPMMFEYALLERARAVRRHIVLPEGTEERILRAAEILLRRGVCELTLLGAEPDVRRRIADLGLDLPGVRFTDPADSLLRDQFAERYAKLRAHRGVTLELARDVMSDPNYFGTMMVEVGMADGMVSGSVHTTAATIRPAFEIIKTSEGTSTVSSVFFMLLPKQVLVYGDCAVNPDPTADQLADIAISSAATAALFGVEPRVAMLSYSTGASGTGADVEKVRDATQIIRERAPELLVEGPLQYDAAVDPTVAATKVADSAVAGHATVLIFPDLNRGNNTYKAVQRSAGAIAVGPVLQGLRKPVNDLSRGALVSDIVNTIAITAIQAQRPGF